MKHFEFPSSFLTGHAVIDDDHRRIIALLNKINSRIRGKRGDEAYNTCAALQRFLAEHLDREEKILRDAGFQRLEAHIKSHYRMAEESREAFTCCGNACLSNKAEGCTKNIYIGILEHIVGKDLDFKSFLQAEGLADNSV